MLRCPAHFSASLTLEPEGIWTCPHGCRWQQRVVYKHGRAEDAFDPAPTGDVAWAYGEQLHQLTSLRNRYWREEI